MSDAEQKFYSDLNSLPSLPRDEEGPVFAEPWQAQAFAMAVDLSKQGLFSWKEWAQALADELKLAAERGDPDDGSRYYYHWVTALEKLILAKNVAAQTELTDIKSAWEQTYLRTPHGEAVEL
ncbi:MAG: nitrile hydratase accessory protein [Gammaproteobacteria bacterium]|nr:nitrile hydratase accessory protein [Gammaproteobacteria bacterium]MDD9894222.1 nitrile hydratase accessory protein [Gammaproteobacteria bacterium]MDD9957423.1 nitrile hydratase accessory protein [Gammaproteobacteria bacterium]